MKRLISIFLSAVVLLSFGSVIVRADTFVEPLPSAVDDFIDVTMETENAEFINELYSHYVMRGVTSTKFEPDMAVTRAMLVTLLYRSNFDVCVRGEDGEDERKEHDPKDYAQNSFSDVKKGAWYETAVNWASSLGIVAGYPDGSFKPNADLTREEYYTILARYYKAKARLLPSDENGSVTYIPHADYDEISDWAKESYRFCVSVKLIDVKTAELDEDGKLIEDAKYYFEPQDTVTRAAMAGDIWNMFEPFRDYPYSWHFGFAKYPVIEYVPYFG